ncbi:protein ALP1-like [Photinus pyralis]|uniref:protein ALP1-like n=1 Tax=Photinus pyralis TaxID=7054 RepID=UPI001266F899|nr:protein ALP1-like [Photinus pyralis]
MSKDDFNFLLRAIKDTISKKDTTFRRAVPPEERLAVTLRFLATGDSYTSLQYLFKISKQLISEIVPEVCQAIIDSLINYVKMPSTAEEWKKISQQFEEKWNFPRCIGAIDGKHVTLQAPTASGSEFYNYKSQFSIVLMAVVDADYNFIFVDTGCQGRISDGGVFKNCELFKRMDRGNLNLPQLSSLVEGGIGVPYVFVADAAFPLSDNIMKPYVGVHPKASPKRIYNYRLSRARRVVENAFGILSSVFRDLRKPLLLEPEKTVLVVMAAVCLHNFLRRSKTSRDLYSPPSLLDTEFNGGLKPGSWRREQQGATSLLDLKNVPRRAKLSSQEIREEFSKYFSNVGTVPWQNDYA